MSFVNIIIDLCFDGFTDIYEHIYIYLKVHCAFITIHCGISRGIIFGVFIVNALKQVFYSNVRI